MNKLFFFIFFSFKIFSISNNQELTTENIINVLPLMAFIFFGILLLSFVFKIIFAFLFFSKQNISQKENLVSEDEEFNSSESIEYENSFIKKISEPKVKNDSEKFDDNNDSDFKKKEYSTFKKNSEEEHE